MCEVTVAGGGNFCRGKRRTHKDTRRLSPCGLRSCADRGGRRPCEQNRGATPTAHDRLPDSVPNTAPFRPHVPASRQHLAGKQRRETGSGSLCPDLGLETQTRWPQQRPPPHARLRGAPVATPRSPLRSIWEIPGRPGRAAPSSVRRRRCQQVHVRLSHVGRSGSPGGGRGTHAPPCVISDPVRPRLKSCFLKTILPGQRGNSNAGAFAVSAGGWGSSLLKHGHWAACRRPVHAGGRGLSLGSRGVIRTLGCWCALFPSPAPPRVTKRRSARPPGGRVACVWPCCAHSSRRDRSVLVPWRCGFPEGVPGKECPGSRGPLSERRTPPPVPALVAREAAGVWSPACGGRRAQSRRPPRPPCCPQLPPAGSWAAALLWSPAVGSEPHAGRRWRSQWAGLRPLWLGRLSETTS